MVSRNLFQKSSADHREDNDTKKKTSLLLKTGGLKDLRADPGHQCDKCIFTLDENASGKVDSLVELEDKAPVDVKQSLVYIAGCIVRRHKPDAAVCASDTTQYYEAYGSYADALNRGVSRSLPILIANG